MRCLGSLLLIAAMCLAADEARIGELIRQLGAEEQVLRDAARDELMRLGDGDEGALVQRLLAEAGDAPDPEIAARIADLVKRVRARHRIVVFALHAEVQALDVESGDRAWTREGGMASAVGAGIDAAAYVADGKSLECVDLGTGDRRWISKGDCGRVVLAETGVFGLGRTTVRRHSIEDGHVEWTCELPKAKNGYESYSVDLRGDRVFVSAAGPLVLCLDSRTGGEIWRADGASCGAPAAGPVIMLPDRNRPREVALLDRETGEPVWRRPLPGNKPLYGALDLGTPLGAVLVWSKTGKAIALDAGTGEERWSAKVLTAPGWIDGQGKGWFDGLASMEALDLATGAQVASLPLVGTGLRWCGERDRLYAATEDTWKGVIPLQAIDTSKAAVLWSADLVQVMGLDPAHWSPDRLQRIGPHLVVIVTGNSDTQIGVFDPDTGKLRALHRLDR